MVRWGLISALALGGLSVLDVFTGWRGGDWAPWAGEGLTYNAIRLGGNFVMGFFAGALAHTLWCRFTRTPRRAPR